MIGSYLTRLTETPFDWIQLLANIIISGCTTVILTAILVNFVEARSRGGIKHQQRSIVATGTMLLFAAGFYLLIHQRIGVIRLDSIPLRTAALVLGLIIIIMGTIFNVKGRMALGHNWANQIKIYQQQTLIQTGVYRIVRHPLYASLIWIFYGAALAYLSLAAFIATSLIFLPFMYYRARQEEKLLATYFEEYQAYRVRTGMFFPKFIVKDGSR